MPRQHVLIIVQNLPVPLDRRVWLECQALRASDYAVSVICPKGPGDPRYEVLDGVHLYKYQPAPSASGALSYLVEFVYCWLRTAVLSVRINRRQPIAVIQACNPPDTYWALARLWRRASGGRVPALITMLAVLSSMKLIARGRNCYGLFVCSFSESSIAFRAHSYLFIVHEIEYR